MRRSILVVACAAGLVFQAAGALAESWSVVEGRIAIKGKKQPLTGSFEGTIHASDEDPSAVLILDDFAFQAGRKQLGPRAPIEYHGLLPVVWLEIANAIAFEGEQVTFLNLRSGGKLVRESADAVTFRFLELRADAADGGYVLGRLGDTELPRRLVLKGDVYEVEQSFGLPGPNCLLPGSGGSPGGADVSARFGRRTFVWQSETGDVVLRGRTTTEVGTSSPIGAPYDSATNSSPLSMRFDMVRYYTLALDGAPTLDQLGMRAPEGAIITADENGAVRVSSQGDLFVERVLPVGPIADLTSVTLSTPGNIVITGRIELPASASLRIEAGGEIRIDAPGPLVPGEDFEVVAADAVTVGLPDFCLGLKPIFPADERPVGRFSLVASAARQVKLDVRLEPKQKRIIPGSDQVLRTVVFGSRSLDVHDIDRYGRLLGRGEAETIHTGLRVFAPVDGDRYRDLVTDFLVRDAEVAYGDREICLVARTLDGELLEGCDPIDVQLSPAAR